MALGRSNTGEPREDGGFSQLKKMKNESVQRSDTVIDATPVEGNLIQVKTPKFITVVGKPANETGFKVVRADNEEIIPEPKKPTNTLVRRTRRADASPVLRLTFPAAASEETVTAALKEFGLTSYKVEQVEGVYTATRADLKSISDDTIAIALNAEGLTATVARQDSTKRGETNPKSFLTLSSLEFDSSKFTQEEIQRWVAEKCVDGELQAPQNPDACYVVRRSAVVENEETRRLVLEDGVTAVIVRSDAQSIPAGYVAVISEAAYGSWGWGHLDFTASLADGVLCDAINDSLYTLTDVLRNIVFYSALPLDVRKELATRALGQMSDYIGTLMDSLPRQLLASVVRSANPSISPEKVMTQETKATATEAKVEAQAEVVKTEVVAASTETFTRADVQKMIADALAAQTVARAAEPKAEVKAEAQVEVKAEAVSRADLTAAITAVVGPMTDAIKALQGTTIVRSAQEAIPVKEDGKTQDVFRGAAAFSGLRTKKTK